MSYIYVIENKGDCFFYIILELFIYLSLTLKWVYLMRSEIQSDEICGIYGDIFVTIVSELI